MNQNPRPATPIIRCFTLLIRCALVLSVVIGQGVSIAQNSAVVDVELTSLVSHWCIDEVSGRVFCSLPNENRIAEYNSLGKEVRQFTVGTLPTLMAIKKNHLVIVEGGGRSLEVIELNTNMSKGQVNLPKGNVTNIFCSKSDSPYCFCVLKAGPNESINERVVRLNVETMETVRLYGGDLEGDQAKSVAMSDDGTQLALADLNFESPQKIRMAKCDEELGVFRFEIGGDNIRVPGTVSAISGNRFWAVGNTICSADGRTKIRELEGGFNALHPTIDVVVSLTSNELVLQTYSDGSVVARIQLPNLKLDATKASDSKTSGNQSSPSFPLVAFDLKNHFAFVGVNQRAYWVDIKKHSRSLKRSSMLGFPNLMTAVTNMETRVPIQVGGRSPASDMIFKLDGRSDIAKVENGAVICYPTIDQVGLYPMKLELYSKQAELIDRIDFSLQVSVPKLDLGFMAEGIRLSTDEKTIAVWGPLRTFNSMKICDIVLVDADTLKIKKRTVFDRKISIVELDSERVYVVLDQDSQFIVMDHSMSDRSNVQIAADRIFQLRKVRSDIIAVGGRTLQLFDTVSWEQVHDTRLGWSDYAGDEYVESIGKNFVRLQGLVVDPRTFECKKIEGTSYLLPCVQHLQVESLSNMFPVTGWGRDLQYCRIADNNRRELVNWETEAKAIGVSPYAPFLVSLEVSNSEGQVTSYVTFRNFVDGSISKTSTLRVSDVDKRYFGDGSSTVANRFGFRESDLFVIDGGYLLKYEIPSDIKRELPMPAHFELSQPIEISVGGSDTLQLSFLGESGKYTISLDTKLAALSLEPESGVLHVDTKSIWDSFLSEKTSTNPPNSFNNHGNEEWKKHSTNARAYRRIGSKDLPENLFAIQVPIQATIRDESGFEDKLQMVVLLLGPQKDIDQIDEIKRVKANEQNLARKKQIAEENAARDAESAIRRTQERDRNRTVGLTVASIVSLIFVGVVLVYALVAWFIIRLINWKVR